MRVPLAANLEPLSGQLIILALGATKRLSRAGLKCWAPHCWALAVPLVNPMIFEPNNYNISVFKL